MKISLASKIQVAIIPSRLSRRYVRVDDEKNLPNFQDQPLGRFLFARESGFFNNLRNPERLFFVEELWSISHSIPAKLAADKAANPIKRTGVGSHGGCVTRGHGARVALNVFEKLRFSSTPQGGTEQSCEPAHLLGAWSPFSVFSEFSVFLEKGSLRLRVDVEGRSR